MLGYPETLGELGGPAVRSGAPSLEPASQRPPCLGTPVTRHAALNRHRDDLATAIAVAALAMNSALEPPALAWLAPITFSGFEPEALGTHLRFFLPFRTGLALALAGLFRVGLDAFFGVFLARLRDTECTAN